MATRKDYSLVAIAIWEQRSAEANSKNQGPGTLAAVSTLDALARNLARRFKIENPHFKADIFLAACGVKPTSVEDMVKVLTRVPLGSYNITKARMLEQARGEGNEAAAIEAIRRVDSTCSGG